jgi:hypothetical protein
MTIEKSELKVTVARLLQSASLSHFINPTYERFLRSASLSHFINLTYKRFLRSASLSHLINLTCELSHLNPIGDSYGALRYRTLSISHAAFASGMNISMDSNGTDILSSSVRSINPSSSRRFTSVCTFE